MDSKNDSSDVLTAVLDNIAQALVVIGPDFRVRAFYQRFVDLFQLPSKVFQVGIDFREVLRIWAAETGQDAAMLERAIRELSVPESFVYEFAQDIHGEERWCQLFHNPLPEGGCVRTFSNITERKHLEEELRVSASIDPLTEIPNRREFINKLNQEVARSQRYRHGLVMVMVDTDHFKNVNDEWGHPVGDLALTLTGSDPGIPKKMAPTCFGAHTN